MLGCQKFVQYIHMDYGEGRFMFLRGSVGVLHQGCPGFADHLAIFFAACKLFFNIFQNSYLLEEFKIDDIYLRKLRE